MAGRKENLKSLFSNTRTRVIIVLTGVFLLTAVVIGVIKFTSTKNLGPGASVEFGGSSVDIASVPGALNPTVQYANLQEEQNISQAKNALQKGSSAIPTIIRTQVVGQGVSVIGPQNGEGGVGFSTLATEQQGGLEKSLWLQNLKDASCSKSSVTQAVNQGAQLSDLKEVCSCLELQDGGYQLSDLGQVCSCKELKGAGFNARQLKDQGYSAERLRNCGFDACELRSAGFTAQEMKDGGFSDGELKGAGFSDQEIARASGIPDGMTADVIRKAGCDATSLQKLHAAGVSAAAIRRINGCSPDQLKAAGYSAQDLKNAGFTAAELVRAGFTPAQLSQAGYDPRDLLNAGFSPAQLASVGYTPDQIAGAENELPPGITPDQVKAAGCGAQALQKERQAGVSAQLIKQYANCSASDLKAAGFTDSDLANAGFNPGQISGGQGLDDQSILAAGTDPDKLKALFAAGVPAGRIHQLNGATADQLKAAGFGARDLLNAGFTPQQLLAAGFTPDQIKQAESTFVPDQSILAAGTDPDKLKALFAAGVPAGRIHQLNGATADQLKAAGFGAKDLLDAGFTPQQLLAAGFTPDQVKQAESTFVPDQAVRAAGTDPQKLKALFAAGVPADRIHQLNGATAAQLKAAGFGAKDLMDAGFTPQQLLAAGFTPQQLLAAGFTPAQLLAAGVTAGQLTPGESNFVPDEAIVAAGTDPQKLKDLYGAGISAARIHQLNGATANQLKAAGFGAKDLLDAGFTPQQLLAAGFTPDQIKQAQSDSVPDGEILAAGVDPQKLNALLAEGVTPARIHELTGASASQLKAAGASAKDLLDAGFTPQQLLSAGFSPAEVKAAQAAEDTAIRAAGCDPDKLKALHAQGVSAQLIHELNGCSADALKAAGYNAGELLDAGFTPRDLVAAGFSPDEAQKAQMTTDSAIRAAGCNPDKLNALRAAGVSALRIHQLNGCSAAVLKAAGFGAQDLLDAGFTPKDLLAAGFTPDQVAQAQSAEQTNAKILAAGNDPTKLKALLAEGVSASQIRKLTGATPFALKSAGFGAKDLLNAGYTPEELLAAGFTPDQIKAAQGLGASDASIRAAGCDPDKLRPLFVQGVTAERIHQLNGCTANALRQAGYDAKSLIAAGFSPDDLVAAGFTPQDLVDAGIQPAAIIAGGRRVDCSAASLQTAHAQGISAIAIEKTLGCSAGALKAAGYSAAELKSAGFTAAELKAAGFSAADLKSAGYSAKDLRDAGFSAQALKNAGFSAKQLHDAGFSAADLSAAGFTVQDLKNAGYSAAELGAAGFSPSELKAAGFSSADLQSLGLSADGSQGGLGSSGALGNTNAGVPQNVGTQLAALPGANVPGVSSSNVAPIPSIQGGISGQNSQATEAANAKQLQQILQKQNQQLSDQRFQQQIQQRTAMMVSAANQAIQGWQKVPTQTYIGSGADDTSQQSSVLGIQNNLQPGAMPGPGELTGPNGGGSKKALVKTGDIIFAVLDTSVNSDQPGPILATVVTGQFKGARLIGSFNLPSNSDTLVISFNTMSVPGADKSTSINAYAIDPNTAQTALSSRADHHYLLRYGSLFASSFLEGFGNAFQSANTTVTIGGTAGGDNVTVQNGIGRSALQNAVIGMATLGKSWGQVAQQQFSTPITVEVFSGTPMGILFTQDLVSL